MTKDYIALEYSKVFLINSYECKYTLMDKIKSWLGYKIKDKTAYCHLRSIEEGYKMASVFLKEGKKYRNL